MTEYYKELYSIDQSKNIVVWNITVVDNHTNAKIIIEYGKYGGNLARASYPIRGGKNIGKANETDYLTQAILEAESRVRKQISKGYRETIEELKTNRQDKEGDDKPMLAQKFKPNKFKYPAFIQPKLNGVRVNIRFKYINDGLFGDHLVCSIKSREGVEYTGVQHINDALLAVVSRHIFEYDNLVLDGELYCHNMFLQDIRSACTKTNTNSYKIQLWLFDVCSDEPQHIRFETLNKFYNLLSNRESNIIINTPTSTCYSDDIALLTAEEYISMGYEGAMLRDMNAPYQFGKRSKYLVKIKKVKYDKFKVIDVVPTDKDIYAGKPIALFICQNDINHLTFTVTPAKSKAERSAILTNKDQYINTYITVSYFERTKEGIPFHANGR